MKKGQRGRKTKYPGVWEVSPGRFRVRTTVVDPRTGRQKESERIVEALNAKEALDRRCQVATALEAAVAVRKEGGQKGLRASTQVGVAAQAWVDEITTRRHEQDPRQLHLCPSTRLKYQTVVRDFVKPSWLTSMTIGALRKDDVRRWRKEQLDAGYASSTVNGNFSVLQSILRAAGNSEAAELPMLSTKQDAKTNRKQPNKLTAQELDRFLAAAGECCSPDRYAAVLMLFTTTLRPGALIALRMDDLDLETMEVVSSRRLSLGEVVPGVKGDRFGEDTPPLLPEVHVAILEARKGFNEAQLASGLVFPAKDGRFHDRQWLTETFRDICKRAGLTKRFTPTGARRTGETWYGRTSGTRVAMAISGHRTEAMHRHYGSADAAEKLEVAARTWAPHLRVVSESKKDEEPKPAPTVGETGVPDWGSRGSA